MPENQKNATENTPPEHFWGAVTDRNLRNFTTGSVMPFEVISALLHIKKAAAQANLQVGVLDEKKAQAIKNAVDLILRGDFQAEFPLRIWQTGSGTATNMNVNEVIANLARTKFGVELHPNNDVNLAQSTNDTFSSALHITAHTLYSQVLEPQLQHLRAVLDELGEKYQAVVKVGRTHYQEAVPLRFDQEIGAFSTAFEVITRHIEDALEQMRALALGGTAVGTGVNAHPDFAQAVCEQLHDFYGVEFYADANPFYQISNKTAISYYHNGLKELAMTLTKLGNDLRLLSMGPRSGIGELILKANEPGSSIMPGKVNPTQIEALLQVCAAVIGNDTAVALAVSGGSLQLNVYMPLLGGKLIESTKLLGQVLGDFINNCLVSVAVNEARVEQNLQNNLMQITYLVPEIGYDLAAQVAKLALAENITIAQALQKTCPEKSVALTQKLRDELARLANR
jgi:fumarate hydratase class II